MLILGIMFGEIPLVVNFIILAWERPPWWQIFATYHRITHWWPLRALHFERTPLLDDFSKFAWEHPWWSILAT